jgi:hypothetical protein
MERGQDGWIYLSHEKLKEEYGTDIEAAIRYMVGEVEEYGRWLTGETYGYIIKERGDEDDEDFDEDDAEEIESCWGFIGFDYVKEAAEEAADNIAEQRLEEAKKEVCKRARALKRSRRTSSTKSSRKFTARSATTDLAPTAGAST